MRNRIGSQKETKQPVKVATVKRPARAKFPTHEESMAMLESPFKTDRERIKYNTEKYAGVSIAEAFGAKATTQEAEILPIAKMNVGDTIKLNVTGVTKGNVELDNTNLKCDVQFAVDLNRFPAFSGENVEFPQTIDAKIINKKGNTITVDPLALAYDNFQSQYDERGLLRQYNEKHIHAVSVNNLRLVPGGFIGDLVVPQLSNLTGKATTVKAFIPGSQIVANIENDFSKWEGQNVECFVTNVVKDGENTRFPDIKAICSRKAMLRHIGNMNIVSMFKDWTEENKKWAEIEKSVYEGTVTGVINTAKNRGVFVEIGDLNITTLVAEDAEKLSSYKAGDTVKVKITGFDEPMTEGPLGQMVHEKPYVIIGHTIRDVKVRPIVEFAK